MKESEKLLERKLGEKLKKMGGWSIKLLPNFISGIPDRLCLVPPGKIFFAEMKTTGEKPEPRQLAVHRKLIKMGFRVEVIDTSKQIEDILREYETD